MGHPALELQAAGFEIGLLDDGRVLVKPKSRLTEETCQFIKAHKQELVDYLRRQAANDQATAAPMPEFGKTKRVTPAPLPPAPQTPQPRMTPRSGAEIVRMIGLHRRALAVGLPNNSATGKVLDELMDTPDMGSCFACRHLRGAEPERWRCAGHGHDLAGLPLARDWVAHLHRCDGYQPPPEGTPT